MAEGHAVRRWARSLRALIGEPLLEVTLPRRWAERQARLPGQHVVDARAHGKHLLVPLSGGETIHCHAMQYGSWQIEPLGPTDRMAYRKEARFVRLRLRSAGHEAVFYHGPVVEVLTPAELAAHATLNALGPDVMSPDFDRGEVARRVLAAGAREIGDVVLDQKIVAGLGNIFKSEALFLAGLHPRRPAAEVEPDELDRIWDGVAPIMWRGVESFGPTKTTPPELQQAGHWHWTYRRRGQACLRCDGRIEMIRQGELQRSTYFCPRCQPEVVGRAEAALGAA